MNATKRGALTNVECWVALVHLRTSASSAQQARQTQAQPFPQHTPQSTCESGIPAPKSQKNAKRAALVYLRMRGHGCVWSPSSIYQWPHPTTQAFVAADKTPHLDCVHLGVVCLGAQLLIRGSRTTNQDHNERQEGACYQARGGSPDGSSKGHPVQGAHNNNNNNRYSFQHWTTSSVLQYRHMNRSRVMIRIH